MREFTNRSGIWAPLALLGALFTAVPAAAAPMLVLSSPDNLGSLQIDDEFQIDVVLEGIDVGNNFVFVLNSGLLFPGALVDPVPASGTTSGLSPGAILEVAGQRASFDAVSALSDGVVTGNFSDSSPQASQAISHNGTYYSFRLKATGVGLGTVSFDPGNTTFAASSTGFNLAPLATGSALNFQITAVPEPSSLILFGAGVLGLGWMSSRRRRGLRA